MIQHKVSDYGLERMTEARQICCDYWKVDPKVVFTKTRTRDVMNARHSIRYLLSTDKEFSLAEIGGLTNGDHTSVIHSKKQFLILSEVDNDFRVLLGRMTGHKRVKTETFLRRKITNILKSQGAMDVKNDSLYRLIMTNSVG